MALPARPAGVAGITPRLLQNTSFRPISALDSKFKPRNTQGIPVVKLFVFLELERN